MAYPFIVFEGIDGAGKAVQIEHLKNVARKKRQRVFVHKFPTQNAKKIHRYLNGNQSLNEDELFEQYLTDIENEQQNIKTHVGLGWVICDRYAISTVAYQSIKQNMQKRIEQIDDAKLIKPDLVVWLDLPVDVAIARKTKQKKLDIHESNFEFLQKVLENYKKLYSDNFLAKEWLKINAQDEPQTIAKQVSAFIFKQE